MRVCGLVDTPIDLLAMGEGALKDRAVSSGLDGQLPAYRDFGLWDTKVLTILLSALLRPEPAKSCLCFAGAGSNSPPVAMPCRALLWCCV
jgi:hypothetical protein